MFLRPRYSLLTLLLLTAAVAVGIKLWRGPHQMRITAAKQGLLNQLGYQTSVNELGEFETTLEYINHFDRTEYIVVLGTPRDPDDLYLDQHDAIYLVCSKHNGLGLGLPPDMKKERIVRWACWLPDEKTAQQLLSGPQCICGNHALEKANKLYLISNQGRIFQPKYHFAPLIVNLVEADSIQDLAIRTRVLAEATACVE